MRDTALGPFAINSPSVALRPPFYSQRPPSQLIYSTKTESQSDAAYSPSAKSGSFKSFRCINTPRRQHQRQRKLPHGRRRSPTHTAGTPPHLLAYPLDQQPGPSCSSKPTTGSIKTIATNGIDPHLIQTWCWRYSQFRVG